MMFDILYEYLIKYRRLILPRLGTISVQRRPAVLNFAEHTVQSPAYDFIWTEQAAGIPYSFTAWLAGKTETTEEEAQNHFLSFLEEIKTSISNGQEVIWDRVGVIKKSLANTIDFVPQSSPFVLENPVPARKVIHEKAGHTVLVGETEMSAGEALEMLQESPTSRSHLLDAALALGIIAIIFTGWYLSEHGIKPTSVGRQVTITPQPISPTYNELH
jgi:hypothetical protein